METLRDKLLQPAATITAALIASRPSSQPRPIEDLAKLFVAVLDKLQEATQGQSGVHV